MRVLQQQTITWFALGLLFVLALPTLSVADTRKEKPKMKQATGEDFVSLTGRPTNLTQALKAKWSGKKDISLLGMSVSDDGRSALFRGTEGTLLIVADLKSGVETTVHQQRDGYSRAARETFSPDGLAVGFVRSRYPEGASSFEYHIIVADVRSGNIIRTIPLPGNVDYFSLSDGGKSVAYAGPDGEIYVSTGDKTFQVTKDQITKDGQRKFIYWQVTMAGSGGALLYLQSQGLDYSAGRSLVRVSLPDLVQTPIDVDVREYGGMDPPSITWDGSKIIYLRSRGTNDLVLADLASGQRISLGYGRHSHISKSGRFCVFVNDSGIVVYDTVRRTTVPVPNTAVFKPLWPRVTNDEKAVIFIAQSNATLHPREIDTKTGKVLNYYVRDHFRVDFEPVRAK